MVKVPSDGPAKTGRGTVLVPISRAPPLRRIAGAVRRPAVLTVMLLDVREMLLAVIAWLMLMFAFIAEALRMREPVVALSDRADAIAMSPAV